MRRRCLILCLVAAACSTAARGEDAGGADGRAISASTGRSGDPALLVEPSDVVITQSLEGGYDVWVRAKAGIGSILLTESSADPAMRENSYALRDPALRTITEGERRMLDGKLLDEGTGPRSIVDSTPEPHPDLSAAYHVFVPYVVVYGYPWSRFGELQVLDGTFINVRAFRKERADYTGPYRDNPFRISITQKVSYLPSLPPPETPRAQPLPEARPPAAPSLSLHMPDAVRALTEIAADGKGEAKLSTGEDDLGEKIGAFLDGTLGESLDLVLALDTTNSMRDDMLYLRKSIVTILAKHTSRFSRYRVGLLYYRDYNDDYLVKPNPFVSDLGEVQRQIDSVQVGGGRDIPEAVYEALYAAIERYEWTAEARLVLLIGDAPPHPLPRGKVTREMVYRAAEARNIRINTIILPP